MPNIDETAKAWKTELAGRLGATVQARRKALNMTALQLAARTKELGYPVARVAISKIETNTRAGKFDLDELFVLAAALDIPPTLLLFPGGGGSELLPGLHVDDTDGRAWLAGTRPLPGYDLNPGTRLLAAMRRRHHLRQQLFVLRSRISDGTTALSPDPLTGAFQLALDNARALTDADVTAYEQAIADLSQQLDEVKIEITELTDRLWDGNNE
jgi:transcriptional regulator with XRE-family HTH domain